MIAQRFGRIVLVTGRHAIRGSSGSARNRDDGRATVAIAKHGLWGLAKSLANEFGHHGITANAVSPGFIDKENDPAWTARGEVAKKEIPVARIGQPQDISATCGFLCSEEASFITGQMIGVNGGVEY
jgi:NAD(P)-dependent dehydrogenase (short-subunit alcohol dehydrogenase family)